MTEDDNVEVGHEKQDEISLDEMLASTESAPVIRIVNSVIVEALRRRASDIHIQPMEKTLRLRYRIDGDLYEAPSAPKNLQSAIISRIKIMSNMNIAERRIPQDGRFRVKAGNEAESQASAVAASTSTIAPLFGSAWKRISRSGISGRRLIHSIVYR